MKEHTESIKLHIAAWETHQWAMQVLITFYPLHVLAIAPSSRPPDIGSNAVLFVRFLEEPLLLLTPECYIHMLHRKISAYGWTARATPFVSPVGSTCVSCAWPSGFLTTEQGARIASIGIGPRSASCQKRMPPSSHATNRKS